MKIFYLLFLSFFVLYGQPLKLSNKQITFSVSNAGTLGTGLRQKAKGLIYQRHDYLNQVGVPFEFFSLKVNEDVYANDNAQGYKKRWPAEGLRLNRTNMPTTLKRSGKSIVATTVQDGLFQIKHTYSIGDLTSNDCVSMSAKSQLKNINVQVEVSNLSSLPQQFVYTRGIDMDPPDVDTINTMGYSANDKFIPPENLIYTVSAKHSGRYPLSLFSKDSIKHTGAILEFDHGKGCLYDPETILSKSQNSLNGDGVVYMIFELGEMAANESKTFSFSYYLNDKLEQLIVDITDQDLKVSPADGLAFDVARTASNVYEKTVTKNISIMSNVSGINKRRFRLHYNTETLPKGTKLMFNGKALSDAQMFRYNQNIAISISRNSDYKTDDMRSIALSSIDIKCHQKSHFSVTMTPEKRKVTLAIQKPPATALDALETLEPVSVKVLVNGKEMKGQGLKDLEISSHCDGINCSIQKDVANNQFLLYIKPKKILAFTAVGEVEIKLELTKGTFEDDQAKATTSIYVEDIGFKKWIMPLLWLLLLLLLLWYLYGITLGKKRFKKNQVVSYEELVRGKRDPYSAREYHLRKEVGFFDMLIPYKAQEVRIQDMIFRAERNRRVYLSKKTQEYVKYNGRDVEEAGKRHLRLDGGDTLKTDYAIYTIL